MISHLKSTKTSENEQKNVFFQILSTPRSWSTTKGVTSKSSFFGWFFKMNKKGWKPLKKSSLTSFWVRSAPKSWTKYTTHSIMIKLWTELLGSNVGLIHKIHMESIFTFELSQLKVEFRRRHTLIKKSNFNSHQLKSTFINDGVKIGNLAPMVVKNCTSLNGAKKEIKKFAKTLPF